MGPLPALREVVPGRSAARRRTSHRARLPGLRACVPSQGRAPVKGRVYPSEARWLTDAATGRRIRQVTDHPSIHHHPFFFVPPWDDAMRRLIFVSHRTGSPQLFAETNDRLVQLTERLELSEWSFHPSHDGRFVVFVAGTP